MDISRVCVPFILLAMPPGDCCGELHVSNVETGRLRLFREPLPFRLEKNQNPRRARAAPRIKVAIEMPATAPLDIVEWVRLGFIDGVVVAEVELVEDAVPFVVGKKDVIEDEVEVSVELILVSLLEGNEVVGAVVETLAIDEGAVRDADD
jgi:hypothetical protein